jgi:predicted ribosome quality control (RQC) complex YloA/Tae2 family protein
MSLNWREIDLVLAEIDMDGALVQGVVQPGYDCLFLELYKPGRAFTLFVSIASGGCRLHLTGKPVPKVRKALRFQEFLRSRILGSRISRASQLSDERIVRIELERPEERLTLFIRLWSNAANVILADAELSILDVMSRKPKKGEISGGRLVLPEPQSLSPGAKPKKSFEAREFPGEGPLSARIEAFYDQGVGALSLESLRKRIDSAFAQDISAIKGGVDSLSKTLKEFDMADSYRHFGELLLSNPGAPVREGRAEVEDYLEPGKTLRIAIDPGKSLKGNAQGYFDRAKKAKTGRAEVERELAQAEAELVSLRGQWEGLKRETDPIVLDRFLALRNRPQAAPRKNALPGIVIEKDGWTIIVGKSGKDNDQILRRHVRGNDLWLHARDFAGAYVFVKSRRDRSVPLDILLDAANLALYHSKARSSGSGDLYYTQVKHLRRAKDGPLGLVLPTQEKNLRVKIDPERLRALKGSAPD